MPGQSSEEAAELVATIRGEHVVMKNWFMGSTREAKELRDKYGPYPGLWKEVLNWPGWKEARKAYLKFVQAGESNPPSNSSDGDGRGEIPRKRRSRWGVADDENGHSGSDGQPPSQKPRRSRWGQDSGGPAPGPPPAPAPAAIPRVPLPGAPPSIKPLPGLGLPGMPQNLSPQQQEEFRRCQTRLREINTKLDNLEAEASRVDALPRGHRERSPSPPPGKYCARYMMIILMKPLNVFVFLRSAHCSAILQFMGRTENVRTLVLCAGDNATRRKDRIFWKS